MKERLTVTALDIVNFRDYVDFENRMVFENYSVSVTAMRRPAVEERAGNRGKYE
jgi:hypothetical protein